MIKPKLKPQESRILKTLLEHNYHLSTTEIADISAQITTPDTPAAGTMKADGTAAYVLDVTTSGNIFQFTLSTPWDLGSVVYSSKTLTVGTQDPSTKGITFNADGTQLITAGRGTGRIYAYTLSIAWDISTASFANEFNVTTTTSSPSGIDLINSDFKLYVTS